MRTIAIELTDYRIHEVNTHWWKQILSLFLKPGRAFEIRHWRAEKDIVEKACAYGTISERDSTDFEVSIKGVLTDAIIQEILHADASCPDEQITEFFTINVAGEISSSHYGRELYVSHPTKEVCDQLSAILTPVQEYFTISEYGE